MFKYISILILTILSFVLFTGSSKAQDDATKVAQNVTYNIEGVFGCDWNGKYYIRQIGNEIFWYGEGDKLSPEWSNVAHGTINGNILNLTWADVPKGSIMQKGTLVIQINSNDNFIKLSMDGDNFGSTEWTRIKQ